MGVDQPVAQDRSDEHLGVLRFAALTAVPWRNGGGVTRQVLSAGGSGPADFDWRISIADVGEPGPFSAFPGVDRVITVVQGQGMDLVVDGVDHVLGLHQVLRFDGASRTSCTRLAGPIRDLNVMTRRQRFSATVAVRDLSQTRPIAISGSRVLVLLSGSAVVVGADGSRAGLEGLDAVGPGDGHVRLVEGSGRAAVVRIESRRHPLTLEPGPRGLTARAVGSSPAGRLR